jgi:DinB superfamily
MTTATAPRTHLDTLMAHVEEMWGHLAILFDRLNATNGWDQRHGPDWTFADVPYHLAYCDRDLVARGLALGADLPAEEQELLASPADLDAWNTRKLAARPAGQTVAQSLEEWRAACAEIRRITDAMTDADLARPFWMPIYRGWATARDGLDFCRNHAWSEFTQLRIHMGRNEPIPSPAIGRDYLSFMLSLYPMIFNRQAASSPFTAVMAFTDPGVGAWTIRAAEGTATLSEGATPHADLVMTQSAETFEKCLRGMKSPAAAIEEGAIHVTSAESLATFARLFPLPT